MIEALRCSSCKEDKPISEFHKQSGTKRGYNYNCKNCAKKALRERYSKLSPESKAAKFAQQKKHRQDNRDKYRAHWLKYNYNLTADDYDRLLASQNNVCAICETDSPGHNKTNFCIDHDHQCCSGPRSCGECVRGLLCSFCNHGLGSFRDDIGVLEGAIAYLGGEHD